MLGQIQYMINVVFLFSLFFSMLGTRKILIPYMAPVIFLSGSANIERENKRTKTEPMKI